MQIKNRPDRGGLPVKDIYIPEDPHRGDVVRLMPRRRPLLWAALQLLLMVGAVVLITVALIVWRRP